MRKIICLIILSLFLSGGFVFAQDHGGLDTAAGVSGLKDTAITKTGSVPGAIGLILGQAMLYLGIIFFLLIVYAGFLWLTAGGAEAKVEKAKGILIAAVSGLVVVLSAYAIVNFVFGKVLASAGCAREGGICMAVSDCNPNENIIKDNLCPGDQGFKCCIPKQKTP